MTTQIRCLISAGPTREWIDPVRFISNPSSGKMGYALAEEAVSRGFKVDLVSGPVSLQPPTGAEVIKVESAQEMQEAMSRLFDQASLVIMTAAVCDHRPSHCSREKIKKSDFPNSLELVPNNDVVASLVGGRRPGQKIVGFAAETENLLEHARQKLESKDLDWIAANDVSSDEHGFQSDFNDVTLLSKSEETIALGRKSKSEIAKKILDYVWP